MRPGRRAAATARDLLVGSQGRADIEGERNNRDREQERLTVVIHGRIAAQADARLICRRHRRRQHLFSGSQIYQTTIEAVVKEVVGR